jgi:hypothetical protein
MAVSRQAVFAGVALLFLGTPMLAARLHPNAYEGGRSRDVRERAERNSSAIATILGELRTSTSDILFIKTERYLHSGVAYMPHMGGSALMTLDSETEGMDSHQAEMRAQAAGDDHDHDDHAGTPTVIRGAKDDFRGFVGRLHREVKPWRDPELGHLHTDGSELLPWYRVMTLADPRNVRGYAIAAWWLKGRNVDEGIRFLDEGIANNPEAFQLPYMQARLYFQKALDLQDAGLAGDAPEVVQQFRTAVELHRRAAELSLRQRPPGWTPESNDLRWTDYTEEDFRANLRLLVLMENRYGNPQDAVARARQYLDLLGQDPVLARFVARHGSGGE